MEEKLNTIRDYADNAHGTQMRKYTPERYIVYLVITLMFSINLISCKKVKTDFEETLINNKWVYYPHDKVKKDVILTYYIKFFDNNEYENFHIITNREDPTLHNTDSPKKWEYREQDKRLLIGGHEFRVLSVSGDTIRLERKDGAKNILLNISGKKYDRQNGLTP